MTNYQLHRKPLPNQAALNEILKYDPKTGILSWRQWKSGRKVDGQPGYIKNGHKGGHRKIGINRTEYYAHRLIWKMVYGEDPLHIDHLNGNRDDNRLVNLRAVDGWENNRNMKRFCTNTSGCTGVYFHKGDKKWAAEIFSENKKQYLGCFTEKSDAIAARKAAEQRLGYHPNHGRTA